MTLLLVAMATGAARVEAATLVWDANPPEEQVVSYVVHISTPLGTVRTDVGPVTSFPLVGLNAGQTYSIYLTAVNSSGLESDPSAPVTYTPAGLPTAPAILAQPSSQTVPPGATVNFTVTANGTAPLTYQWYKDAQLLPGQTGESLSIAAVSEVDAGTYFVKVSNLLGSVDSAGATLTVQEIVTSVPPAITTQPVGGSFNEGMQVLLSVAATGTGPLSYQWFKDGQSLAGRTATTLLIASAVQSDSGAYTVRVSNTAGETTSSAAIVDVQQAAPVPPVILTQPSGGTFSAGGQIQLSVTASGTGPLSYQWFKDGQSLSGRISATLLISSAMKSDSGAYTVRVSNAAGEITSSAAMVNVQDDRIAPTIVSQPVGGTFPIGAQVALTVVPAGTGPFVYEWFKNGQLLIGRLEAKLVLNIESGNDAGSYTVQVSNMAGSVMSDSAAIKVLVLPVLREQPSDKTVHEDESVRLVVSAGDDSTLEYQWLRNGSEITGATSPEYVIASAKESDAGTYQARVSNAAGSVESSTAVITVILKPRIAQQPVDVTVNQSKELRLAVQVLGSNPLAYQWFKEGQPVEGQTSSELRISAAQESDAGIYTVRVSNPAGSVESNPARVGIRKDESQITIALTGSGLSTSSAEMVGTGLPGTQYDVEFTTDLSSGKWTVWQVVFTDATGKFSIAPPQVPGSNWFIRTVRR